MRIYVTCFIQFVKNAMSVCDDRVKFVDEYVRLGPVLFYSRRYCRIKPKYKIYFTFSNVDVCISDENLVIAIHDGEKTRQIKAVTFEQTKSLRVI